MLNFMQHLLVALVLNIIVDITYLLVLSDNHVNSNPFSSLSITSSSTYNIGFDSENTSYQPKYKESYNLRCKYKLRRNKI